MGMYQIRVSLKATNTYLRSGVAKLVPVLLEAIKELKTEVDALKQEIEFLKKQ